MLAEFVMVLLPGVLDGRPVRTASAPFLLNAEPGGGLGALPGHVRRRGCLLDSLESLRERYVFCATTDELKAESGLSRDSLWVALIALESSCGILRHHRVGEGVTANKLWQRCEVPTPPSSLRR